MLKRERGYNPENGDWEYLVLDGAASKIVERGRMASCSSCHAAYSSTDFLTRHIFPLKFAGVEINMSKARADARTWFASM